MNQSVSEGEPSAGQTSMLPDFIQKAAKRAHSGAHMYAQSRCDPPVFVFPSASLLMVSFLGTAAFSARN